MDNFVVTVGEQIAPLVIQFIVVIVGLVFTYLGTLLGRLFKGLNERAEGNIVGDILKRNEQIVKDAVAFVEQEAKKLDLHGHEKFNLAKKTAIEHAEKAGITIAESDIDLFIEKAVLSLNTGFNEGRLFEQGMEDMESSEGINE